MIPASAPLCCFPTFDFYYKYQQNPKEAALTSTLSSAGKLCRELCIGCSEQRKVAAGPMSIRAPSFPQNITAPQKPGAATLLPFPLPFPGTFTVAPVSDALLCFHSAPCLVLQLPRAPQEDTGGGTARDNVGYAARLLQRQQDRTQTTDFTHMVCTLSSIQTHVSTHTTYTIGYIHTTFSTAVDPTTHHGTHTAGKGPAPARPGAMGF